MMADAANGTSSSEATRARREQLALSALFLALLGGVFVAVSLLARSSDLERVSAKLQLAQWQRSKGIYAYHPLARDPGDYLLLRQLANVDLKRGGTVYIGSSTLQHALKTWDLPSEQSPFIHNFALESANMREQYLWLRYLVEYQGLGSAGPGKTMVILALSHLDTRDKLLGLLDSSFIDDLFKRYGLFDYDPVAGIAPKPLPRFERALIEEKARNSALLQQLAIDVRDEVVDRVSGGRRPPVQSDQADQADQAAMELQMNLMGGPQRWRSALEHQVQYLARSIDDLQARGIDVQAVVLPMKTFNNRQPFAQAFMDATARLCERRKVPLTDYSRRFPDTAFADGTHLGHAAHLELSPLLLAPAVEHLTKLRAGR
jgi:hypothetical protein